MKKVDIADTSPDLAQVIKKRHDFFLSSFPEKLSARGFHFSPRNYSPLCVEIDAKIETFVAVPKTDFSRHEYRLGQI